MVGIGFRAKQGLDNPVLIGIVAVRGGAVVMRIRDPFLRVIGVYEYVYEWGAAIVETLTRTPTRTRQSPL